MLSSLLVVATLVVSYIVLTNTPRKTKQDTNLTRSSDTSLEVIGKQGEDLVKSVLEQLPSQYISRHNIYIPKNNGEYSQIDHIVFSPYAIFVIETKNYAGIISQTGASKLNHWLRTLSNGDTLEFFNPILQNKQHVMYLTSYLGCSDTICCPIVVFAGSAILSDIPCDMTVQYVSELYATIINLRQPLLTKAQINQFVQKIDSIELPDNIKDIHKKNIYKSHKSIGTCPMCNGDLVQRKSQYGQFIGCSNFPSCRYVKNI